MRQRGWEGKKLIIEERAAEGRAERLAEQAAELEASQVDVAVGTDSQAIQALKNVLAVLHEAGGKPEHLVRLTWYVTDKREYLASLKDIGRAFRELIGDYDIAMSAVQVVALIEDEAKVEIEATAVIPRQ